MLRPYDEAGERQNGRDGLRGNLERPTPLSERLGVLAKMRRGFQERQAEGLMTLPELRDRLAELDKEKAAISSELRAAEDATEDARRIEAARSSLLSATWYEEPESLQPGEYLTLGASPEEIQQGVQEVRRPLRGGRGEYTDAEARTGPGGGG